MIGDQLTSLEARPFTTAFLLSHSTIKLPTFSKALAISLTDIPNTIKPESSTNNKNIISVSFFSHLLKNSTDIFQKLNRGYWQLFRDSGLNVIFWVIVAIYYKLKILVHEK